MRQDHQRPVSLGGCYCMIPPCSRRTLLVLSCRSIVSPVNLLCTHLLPVRLCSVIATKAAVPLVYVPLEGVSSKWCAVASSPLQANIVGHRFQ